RRRSFRHKERLEQNKPQTSQLHWRELTEMNMKEEPSTCSLNELMTGQSVGINSKGPEAAQNPDPNSSVLQGPDGTDTDSSLTEDSNENDEDCWRKPLSESETVAEADSDSTRKKTKMSDSGKKAEIECKSSKTQISSFQQIFSKLKIHPGEKPFKCDLCSKCFIQKSYLRRHLRLHTREKPFKCDVCSKCFTHMANLQSHVVMHKEEKPFKCDVCSKCFARKSNLQSHVNMHKEEKPFKCDSKITSLFFFCFFLSFCMPERATEF
uniref:C2H2-type domain-containing protein n=1 Tax=Gouania willdenowi TaxID=441366 RepID=A0A8C5DM03_GOUWI